MDPLIDTPKETLATEANAGIETLLPGVTVLDFTKDGGVEAKPVTPVTGEVKTGPPARSWSRTQDDPERFDSKFEFEGATIYLKSLTPAQRTILKVKQEDLQKQGLRIQEQVKATESNEEKEELGELLASVQTDFMLMVLKMSIRYWENAPIPYSPEALVDLPFEMMFAFVSAIMQKSVSGQTEQELLKNS